MNMMPSLMGLRIIESDFAVELVPKKEHVKKPWMSESYHSRIQKKWLRRFGTISRPCFYVMQGAIIGHPSLVKKVRDLADDDTILRALGDL